MVGNEESVCLVYVCAVAVFVDSASVFPCSCISMCLTLSKSLSPSVPQFTDCPTAAFLPVCIGSPFFIKPLFFLDKEFLVVSHEIVLVLIREKR